MVFLSKGEGEDVVWDDKETIAVSTQSSVPKTDDPAAIASIIQIQVKLVIQKVFLTESIWYSSIHTSVVSQN